MTQERVQFVSPKVADGPRAYGIRKLSEAISGRKIAVTSIGRIEQAHSSHVIVLGLASERPVAELITTGGLPLPEQPESLAIRRLQKGGRSIVVLCGGDEVGLMYAALDTAERIGWATSNEDLFAHVRDTSESPCLTDRSVSTYTMQRRLFEQRLYDEAYWKRYFDMLARDRINSYVIIFGYENGGFMAPYTKAALKKFLIVFPNISGIQFRMHGESGLKRSEMPRFWHEVFSMLTELQPDLRFDLRAKGLPDEIIEDAVTQDLSFRIGTKYWMEQLGLPFHPTHVNPQNQKNRRHGYADLLRYPKKYEMHWRIWSGGTAQFLLWGDPEYVRRFVESAQVYGGKSFKVNEMLATKMLGQPHDEEPFELLTPSYRYYDYEFERYWHYYQVWGRVSYNPDVASELWEHEFSRRFGEKAGPFVMKALHNASRVLPRIVAASYNYRFFPTTRGWAEMMRLGDLPEYAKGTGTDVEQFQSYQDAARQLLSGEFTAKRTPFDTSQWFATVAKQVLTDIDAANATAKGLDGPFAREFRVTTTDLKILAHLARYHASRMKAAVWYNVYRQSQDQFAIDRCIDAESRAIDEWNQIIESAGDVYPETLKFGVHRVGFSWHWKEELPKLEEDLAALRKLPSQATLGSDTCKRMLERVASSTRAPFSISIDRPRSAKPGQDLTIAATVASESELEWIRLCYRHLTQFEDYESVDMTFNSKTGKYVATIPGQFIVPEWNVTCFVEAVDKNGHGRMFPDMEKEMPYVIVPVQPRHTAHDVE